MLFINAPFLGLSFLPEHVYMTTRAHTSTPTKGHNWFWRAEERLWAHLPLVSGLCVFGAALNRPAAELRDLCAHGLHS